MTETVQYQEVGRIGEVEVRRYPKMIVATVAGHSDNEAFGILFNYISGKNRPRQKIAMTAPVISEEKIEMTAPVLSDTGGMSFVLPARYTETEVPQPVDPRITMEEIPEREVAVVRFKGRADQESVGEEVQILLSTLRESGIRTIGEPFLMRYNAPITPGFLRRNEVGVAIERREA